LCHRHRHSCVRLSVCLSVTYLFMAKRYGLPNNCPNKQIGNGLWQIEWSCDRWRHVIPVKVVIQYV